MQAFEILLLVAQSLTLLILSVPHWRGTPWLRPSATVALLIGAAQILAEGPRWQLFPAYGLTALLCCFSMLANSIPAGGSGKEHRLTWLLLGLDMPWLALSIAIQMSMPVFHFPTPTWPYAIGTLTYHWIDPTRLRALTADTQASRELMMQVWYRVWFDELMTLAALPERFSATLVANR